MAKKIKKVNTNEIMEHSIIYKTTSYDMFKNIKGNRLVSPTNYNKLLRSMQEKQLVTPICVNENMEIIDGQHRYLVAKELGKPVYYYIEEGYREEEMKRANLVSSNWNKNDFLNMFLNQNDPTYIKIKDLMDKYGIVISDMIKIIAAIREDNYRETGLAFEEGTIIITDADFIDIENFLECLSLFKDFKQYNRSKFVSAYLELYFHSSYNHSQMVEKYNKRKTQLVPQLTRDGYLTLLANKIYSFGTSKSNIYYDPTRKHLYKPQI
jgi:hypothetical protein